MTGPRIQCEYGERWSNAKVADLLARASILRDANQRMLFIVKRFVTEHTPFLKESYLPPLESNTLRIRFASFDCITFIYYMNALNAASTFTEFADGLRRIRYHEGCVSPDRLIHYAWNVSRNMVADGMVADITAALAGPARLETRTVRLDMKADGGRFLADTVGRLGEPNVGEVVSARFIPTRHVELIEPSLRGGDTILFVSAKDPGTYPGIVWHGAIVYKKKNDVRAYFIHASSTRINHRRPRVAGVSICTRFNPCRKVMCDDRRYRPVHTYLQENAELQGIVVLRPANPTTTVSIDAHAQELENPLAGRHRLVHVS